MTAGTDGAKDGIRVTGSLTVPLSELQFRFSPSGGPGGQHANKVSTRVEIRFDIEHSPSLGPVQRARLLQRLGPVMKVVSDGERSQWRNRRVALDRLQERLADALRSDRVRRRTRPSRGAVERRLASKRRQSEQKRNRRYSPEE